MSCFYSKGVTYVTKPTQHNTPEPQLNNEWPTDTISNEERNQKEGDKSISFINAKENNKIYLISNCQTDA